MSQLSHSCLSVCILSHKHYIVVQLLSHVWDLQLHGLQHARLPCLSLSPGVCSNSCPLSQWCHPTISSCHPFLLLPSIFISIRVFSNELALRIRWPKYWSFNFRPDLSWFLGGFRGMELQELQAVSTAKSQREWHSLNNHQKANRELHKIILLWLVGFWGASKDFHKPRLLETILLDLLPGGSRNPADRHSKLQ